MKYLSEGVGVGALTIALVVGAYVVWKSVGVATNSEGYTLSARLKDVTGLPAGSAVVVAGLPVGAIEERVLEGRYARVRFRLRNDIEVWSNAVVYKKAASLLGNFYLEVDPGTPISATEAGGRVDNERLGDGDAIQQVIEATTPEDLMRRVAESRPNVDDLLLSVRDLSADARRLLDGPVASISSRFDQTVAEERETVRRILRRGERTFAKIEARIGEIRSLKGSADARVSVIVADAEKVAEEGRTLIAVARRELEATEVKARRKLDGLDEVIDHSNSIADKIAQGRGTLARLLTKSTLSDNLGEISEDAKGFVATLSGIQTYVGLRSEYNVRAAALRSYVSVEIRTRPDKFYLVELEKGPRGGYPDVTLRFDPTTRQYRRDVLIEDKMRVTLQLGKRVSWAAFRYGVKESTGGVGFDGYWYDDRLQLSIDLFEPSFDSWPRLKVSAAYEVFKHLYILGGIDEALNAPDTLRLVANSVDVPVMFEEFYFGRDYFLGAQLRFNDKDLSSLLFIGGSAVAAIGQ